MDHWRPVHDWPETRVWDVIRTSGLEVHPAYRLGFSRVSCRFCIFLAADALATLRVLYPAAFARVAAREAASGWTIKRSASLIELAQRGTPFPPALANSALAGLADSDVWSAPMLPASWSLPAGAYGEGGGPS